MQLFQKNVYTEGIITLGQKFRNFSQILTKSSLGSEWKPTVSRHVLSWLVHFLHWNQREMYVNAIFKY